MKASRRTKTNGMAWWRAAFLASALAWLSAPRIAESYVPDGQHWPSNQPVVLDLSLGTPSSTLIDGSTSWNQVAEAALAVWNPYLGSGVQLAYTENTVAPARHDGHNSVFFSSTIFGEDFGADTLGFTLTYYNPVTNVKTESDVIFNSAISFNSYRGPERDTPGGSRQFDLRRVAIHEFGHLLGLAHVPQSTTAIMTPVLSDLDTVQEDDIAGVDSIYGVPVTPVLPPAVTLPTVSATVTVPQATADNGGKGIITLTLSQAQSTDLYVHYTVQGDAVNGTDYKLLSGVKKIKAGLTSKPIKIKPSGDLDGAVEKTVEFTLTPDAAYTVGTTTALPVSIVAGP